MNKENLSDNMDSQKHLPKPAQNILPTVAIPEKIIICLDMCNSETTIPLQALKTAVDFFIRLKQHINPYHEFALVTLESTKAKFIRNFTNHRNITKTLQSLQTVPLDDTSDETFSLDSLFEMATQCIEIPSFDSESDAIYPQNYLVRIIIIYTRSKFVPTFSDSEILKNKLKSPYLFIDTVWMHEESNEENKIEEISKTFKFIQDNEKSYYFESDYNVTKLQNIMAKFLAHPLQRILQKDGIDFKFTKINEEVNETSEEEENENALNIFV